MVLNKFYFIQTILLLFVFNTNNAQNDSYYENESEDYEEFEYLSPLNDKTLEGQKNFVKELLDLSGYILKSIEVYQTLPNNAKVFREGYKIIFGTGSDRNVVSITGIDFLRNFIRIDANGVFYF